MDTIAKSVINNIDRLLFTDDRIIVVDRIGNKCVSFDMEGNFIGSTQKYIGKSEREYIHMIDAALDICDNHVYMYNDFPGSIFILDTDLNLISSIKIDFPMKEFTVSDNEIYFVRNDFDIHDNFSICVVDKNRLTGTPIELQKLKKNVHGVRGSGKSLVNSNGCYATLPFDNRIFKLNRENTECIEVRMGDFWLPDGIEKEIHPTEFLNKYGNYHWAIQNLQTVDSLIFFNTNKGGMFVGDINKQKAEMYSEVLNDILPITNSWIIPSQGLRESLVLEVHPQSIISFKKYLEEKNMNIPTEYDFLSKCSEDITTIVICRKTKTISVH